jgi:hypothetical protein
MAARIYRPLKVIAFSANEIWLQRHELSQAYYRSSDYLAVVT